MARPTMNNGRHPPGSFGQARIPAAGDDWDGLSLDVIDRFLEVMSQTKLLSRSEQRSYRADLMGLDAWMRSMLGRTLISATPAHLSSYLDERTASGLEPRLLDRLLRSLHDFYAHLCACGCRTDNAARGLPVAMPQPPAARTVHRFR